MKTKAALCLIALLACASAYIGKARAQDDDGIFIDGFDTPIEIYPIVLPPSE